MRPDLQALLAKWQPRLRLQDWIIKIGYCHAHDLGNTTCEANVAWELPLKRAKIQILDPAEYYDEHGFAQDVEESVVHELVHLHFAVVGSLEGAEDTVFEQGVDCIAGAIVGLDRKGVEAS